VGSVFFFCLFRSIGAASGTSWFYAILPEKVRGRYFASDQFVSAVGGVGTLLVSAGLFAVLPVYRALLVQYLIALLGSTVSYFSLKKLPDAERPTSISLRTVLRDTPRLLFARSIFRRYVWLAVSCAILATPVPPFAAYYLKVGPNFSTGQIMLFEVLRYLGVMLAAWVIRRTIDATGARPFFLLALVSYAAVAGFWWVYLENGFGGTPGIMVTYFLLGFGAATWAIANLNYLPHVISADERTLAVSVHGAVTACIGGLSPVIWGLFLKGDSDIRGINTGVFQWFFVTVLLGAIVIAILVGRLPREDGKAVEPILIGSAILRPFRAVTYLVNLAEPRSPRKEK
jgi:hypothetical protein